MFVFCIWCAHFYLFLTLPSSTASDTQSYGVSLSGNVQKGSHYERRNTRPACTKDETPVKRMLNPPPQRKKIQDITVRELAEMADINRGTFYLHYKDVFDLMDQIKNELIEEVESVLTHHPVPELVARPSLALSELFPLVQENAEIVSILIGENGDLNFVNRLKRIVSEKCLKGWLDLKCSSDPDTLAAFSAFIVSGCVGTVQYWIESGMKESTEQMAILTEDFILKGIRVLENPA